MKYLKINLLILNLPLKIIIIKRKVYADSSQERSPKYDQMSIHSLTSHAYRKLFDPSVKMQGN